MIRPVSVCSLRVNWRWLINEYYYYNVITFICERWGCIGPQRSFPHKSVTLYDQEGLCVCLFSNKHKQDGTTSYSFNIGEAAARNTYWTLAIAEVVGDLDNEEVQDDIATQWSSSASIWLSSFHSTSPGLHKRMILKSLCFDFAKLQPHRWFRNGRERVPGTADGNEWISSVEGTNQQTTVPKAELTSGVRHS